MRRKAVLIVVLVAGTAALMIGLSGMLLQGTWPTRPHVTLIECPVVRIRNHTVWLQYCSLSQNRARQERMYMLWGIGYVSMPEGVCQNDDGTQSWLFLDEFAVPAWASLSAAGAMYVVGGRMIMRSLRRRRQGACRSCGYDLTGNVTGVCSECGAAIPNRDC